MHRKPLQDRATGQTEWESSAHFIGWKKRVCRNEDGRANIYSLTTFIELLLCSKHYSRHWDFENKQEKVTALKKVKK